MNRSFKLMLWVLWGVAFLLGTVGMVQRLMYGHTMAGYGNYVPWGLWVALYFHGVGIAAGVYLIGTIRYLFFDRAEGALARLRVVILLAAVSIGMGLLAILLDLGRMERAYRIFTSPNFRSMITFNSWMYGAFFVILSAAFVLSYRKDSGWFKALLLVGLPVAIALPSQSGAFFGVVDAKPFWSTALFPFLFLTSAVAAGAGLLAAVEAFIGWSAAGPGHRQRLQTIRWIMLSAVSLYFVLEWSEISLAFWSPVSEHREEWGLVMAGSFWWVFWIVHLLLGGVVPLVLLMRFGRSGAALGAAGLLVAVSLISTRLNILIPGQALGNLGGLQEAFQHQRLSYNYVATTHEYLVALFLVALGIGAFYLGVRLLPVLSRRLTRGTSVDTHTQRRISL